MQATMETARSTVFTALAEAGFSVERIGELRRSDYRAAIPILLEWLPRVEDPYLRWAIVSALGVSWARPAAAPALIEEFHRAGDWPHGYKWAVGQALGDVADDSVWEGLVPLVCNPQHGHARQGVVMAFGRLRQPRAVDVMMALLGDRDAQIVEQALDALGRLQAGRALPRIEILTTHPDRWVRRAAARALVRINRTTRSSCPPGPSACRATTSRERRRTHHDRLEMNGEER